jgi:hypothetical protein
LEPIKSDLGANAKYFSGKPPPANTPSRVDEPLSVGGIEFVFRKGPPAAAGKLSSTPATTIAMPTTVCAV